MFRATAKNLAKQSPSYQSIAYASYSPKVVALFILLVHRTWPADATIASHFYGASGKKSVSYITIRMLYDRHIMTWRR